MGEEIAVSVICNAFNHEAFIRQCLDGIVAQKTNFNFEVLVHDDASTDGTADIIRIYEKKYPKIMKPIYQIENQYSKGDIFQFQYPRVQGKYVAFCEGDDYWTDPFKLQKQFDAMEAHPGVDICAHNAVVVRAENNKRFRNIAPRRRNAIIPTEEVILGGGGFVATNSLFYRAELLENIPPFRRMMGIDYAVQIHGALRGGMLYLSDCMSVYRFMVSGSWSMRNHNEDAIRKRNKKRLDDMMMQLDLDTSGRYHHEIETSIEFRRLRNDFQYKELLSPRYRKIFKLLSFGEKRQIFLRAYFPGMVAVWKKIHR